MATPNLLLSPSGYKAGKLYSVLPNDGTGDFTVSRSTTATRINKDGLIEEVAANVPRLNWEGGCPHLLLEPSRTNTHTYSESASGKSTNNVTLMNNQAISPMGTNTAIKITEDITFNRHRFYADSNTVTSGTTYTISFFVKKNSDNRYVFLNAGVLLGVSGSFDLDTGSVTGDMKVFGVYPNGWYRIGVTKTATSNNTNIYFVQMQQGTTDVSYTGDGSSFYFWGQQFEVGNYPSSYIPVPSTSNVTRTEDKCINAGGLFNDTEGTLFVDLENFTPNTREITLGSGSSNNRVTLLFQGGANKMRFFVASGGTTQVDSSYTISYTFNQRNKIAFKYKQNDFKAYINGTQVFSGTSGDTPVGLSRFDFANFDATTNFIEGKINQAMVFNEALTNAELKQLTS